MAATTRRPAPRSDEFLARSELERLHATCRRQAAVIDRLSETLTTFRLGARALRDENAELRSENARLQAGARPGG
jgi:hypothetical protein